MGTRNVLKLFFDFTEVSYRRVSLTKSVYPKEFMDSGLLQKGNSRHDIPQGGDPKI